jgi:predicted HicB family RNase H-like nuclease
LAGKSINVRGVDTELFRLARAEALREGKKIGEWLNEAIKEKLEKKESKK